MADPSIFSEVLNDFPDHAPQAWAQVQAQLDAEGADVDAVNRAKLEFGTQLNGLVQQFQSDLGQAATGAAEYVKAGFTVAGAVEHVGGLIAGAKNEPPAQLVQTSVGVLVGILVASGAATAGVGAAITGVVAVLTEVLSKAGLFGSPPAGTEICPGVFVNPKPDWVVGCVGMRSPSNDGKPVTAALLQTATGTATNPLWMRFPRPDRDKDWFRPGDHGCYSPPPPMGGIGAAQPPPPPKWTRKVDCAFPSFAWIEWDEAHPDPKLAAFQKAYATAWRINCERALNGQNASSDAEVLAHVAMAWNRAHASMGSGDVFVSQRDLPDWIRQADPPAHGPYIASLIRSMQSAGLTNDFGPDGMSLRVNMGPAKPAKVVKVHLAGLPPASSASPTTVKLPIRGISQLFGATKVVKVNLHLPPASSPGKKLATAGIVSSIIAAVVGLLAKRRG